MFLPVACAQCGKPFQVPEDTLGKPATCPWCHAIVPALPVGVAPASTGPTAAPSVVPTPVPQPTPEPLPLDDDQPAAPPARSRTVTLGLILGSVLLIVLTTTATFLVLRYKGGHGLTSEWRSYTPPDNSCEIDLLGRAAEEDTDIERGERRYGAEGWYSGTQTWIGWRNLTAAQVQQALADKGWVELRKALFDPEIERLKQKYGGYVAKDATIQFTEPITVEVRMETPHGKLIEHMLVQARGSHPRVYYLGIVGKGLDLDGPEVKRFFDSFRPHD
jgi:hypothetical protein